MIEHRFEKLKAATRKSSGVQTPISIGALLAFGCLMPAPRLWAHPSTSPSARAAARLKYHPPANWIRHYLPDDRYKIDGGTWKYVSTELDTYYHRPDSELMLRQSPNGVIGFSSAADAEEAGYRPAPNTNPDYSKFSYDPKPEAVVPSANAVGGAGNPLGSLASMGDFQSKVANLALTINKTGKSRRIAMGDGRSSIVLPPGWGHAVVPSDVMAGAGSNAQKMGLQMDFLRPPGTNENRGGIVLVSGIVPDLPPGFDIGMIFQPQKFRGSRGGGGSRSGRAMSRTSNPMMAGMGMGDFQPATLGGIRGISINPKTIQSARSVGFSGSLVLAGRGNKLYVMALDHLSRRSPGVSTVLNSYRPR